ncbi:MAG TPA: Fe-S cluster assembly protein SufD [Acidobacteriota bacterium]|nr:Fe-S cluster assembly protein SufD [Acidobacteriota bacterium]
MMLEAVKKEIDSYREQFAAFEREAGDRGPIGVRSLRKEAFHHFAEQGFPTTRDEDWKYTNLSPLTRLELGTQGEDHLQASDLERLRFGDLGCPRLTFVNGRFSEALSTLDQMPEGVEVKRLSQALENEPEVVEEHVGRHAEYEGKPFTALNLAFLHEGAFLRVAPNTVVEKPVQILYLSTEKAQDGVSHPHNLVLVGENSQFKFVENYSCLGQARYFNNVVSEVVVGDNAVVDHFKIEMESLQAFHVNRTAVYQGRTSNYRNFFVAFGGSIVRNDMNTVLDGEGSHCGLDGLFVTREKQLVDSFTVMDHAQPNCDSREVYKGILDDHSRGVFHGRIIVRQKAQKTDSKQSSDNLLLSDNALVNTKPQLEIYADDVKCTHGATIGQLDEEGLFYLRSRGIPEDAARGLMIYAFASEVLSRVSYKPLRERLLDYMAEWLPNGELVREAE